MREFGRNPADVASFPEREWVADEDHRRAVTKAREVLSRNAMNRGEFADLYGADAVAADTAYVKNMRSIMSRQEDAKDRIYSEKAEILQAIIHENGSAWLGDRNIQFIKTDEYDDIRNGIDEVVGFPAERTHHHVGLSMDVTFAKHIEDKVESVTKSIRSGGLGYVKYMASKTGRGDLVAPRFLVSTSGQMAERLQRLWLRPRANLDKDAFRFFMADELVWQAKTLKDFAHRVGQREAAVQYDDALYYLAKSARAIGEPSPEVANEITNDPAVKRLKSLFAHWTR